MRCVRPTRQTDANPPRTVVASPSTHGVTTRRSHARGDRAGVSFLVAPAAWFDFIRWAGANVNAPAPIPVAPVPLFVRHVVSTILLM
jgi:hypothetical protein